MKKTAKKLLTFVMSPILAASMAACSGGGSTGESNSETSGEAVVTEAESTNVDDGNGQEKTAMFTAGTYTAAGNGRNGTVQVKVELDSDRIVSVEIGEHSETEGIADPALEKIPERIVAEQSLAVDTISGAEDY